VADFDERMKKLKDSKLCQFLAEKVPNAVEFIGDALPDKGLLGIAKNMIDGSTLSLEDKLEAYKLLNEEMALVNADRADARNREVELAKTGRTDWMMYLAGCVAMGTFILMVIAVIFVADTRENPLFHQLMGIIEGVALTVFAYYFGTSKSSVDKTKLLGK